ncbi:MAG: helix-turn-helix transcriptional regulator [Cetobacterium sp.]|uniref:helix-turn-helix transcriptional regulator n=1 Tax=Cetobacterium sp. TaxID=2071632 RepID=UPI002FC728D6
MKRLSEVLVEVLNKRKITQTKLSEKINVSTGYITDLKKGNKLGSEQTIFDIIEALSLTKEEEKEIWSAWSYERGHRETMEELFALKKENEKLKKMLRDIQSLK